MCGISFAFTGYLLPPPLGLTLDLDSDRLYWVSRTVGTVYWCPILGECHPQVYSDVPSSEPPVSMTLYKTSAVPRDKVFLFYSKNRKIIKVNHAKLNLFLSILDLKITKVFKPGTNIYFSENDKSILIFLLLAISLAYDLNF